MRTLAAFAAGAVCAVVALFVYVISIPGSHGGWE